MKAKHLKTLLYGMLLFSLTACTEDEVFNDVEQEVSFEAVIDEPWIEDVPAAGENTTDTRTYINDDDINNIGTIWRKKETIGVYGSNSLSRNVKFTSTNTSNAATVSFSGSMLGTPKYAYYPYSDDNKGVAYTKVKGTMPAIQDYSHVYKDIVGDYRAGVLESKSWTTSKFKFTRLVSILRFLVDATGTELEGDELVRIEFKVNNNRKLTGDFTIDLQTQEVNLGAFEEGNDCLTLRCANTYNLYANKTYVGYATALPTMQKGDEMTMVVVTNKHKATIVRNSAVTFAANNLYKYPLTLRNFSDMVVEEIGEGTNEPIEGVTPVLNSMEFEVEYNEGVILAKKLSRNGGTKTSSTEVKKEVCEIDQENKKIKLYLPYFNSRKLVPTFEIPEGTALVCDGGEIISGETEVDFAVYKQVAVVNEAGEGVVYDVEFTNTGLPVVVVNQGSGLTTTESDSEYKKASAAWLAATGAGWQPKDADWSMVEGQDNFMIYNPDGTSAMVDKNDAAVTEPTLASTRLRGNVTQQMPKKSFAVKLDSKRGVNITNGDGSTFSMPAHKRWVLLAQWKDRTMMRNHVAFGIANVFKENLSGGIGWNPSGTFVELVYNGVHVGTYYLCEHIKIDSNRLDINDPLDEKDNPYNGDPSVFGYLLECDDGYDETTKFVTKSYIPFLFKDDADAGGEMLAYAKNLVTGIEDNLYKGNYDAVYDEKLDITSMVDFLLIQELMMNSEMKHPKSCYTYINDGKLYAGPVWDFDWNTLPVSSSYSEEGYSYTESILNKAKLNKRSSYFPSNVASGDKSYIWYPMLVRDTKFKNTAAERWNAVSGAISAYVGTIPVMAKKIELSASENDKIWYLDHKNAGTRRGDLYGIAGSSFFFNASGAGYCGDENQSFTDANNTLVNTLNTRISGMNSFVIKKSWPTISNSR